MNLVSSLKPCLLLLYLLPFYPGLVHAEAGGDYLAGVVEMMLIVFAVWICLTVYLTTQMIKRDDNEKVTAWSKFFCFVAASMISGVVVTIAIMGLDGLNIL